MEELKETNDYYIVGEDTTIHVYEGMKLMDIYEKDDKVPTFVTGFHRLDNELKEDIVMGPNYKESRFRFITEEMVNLYLRKNADYGDSFTESLDDDGLLVSKIRMKDKLNRFSQLISNDAVVDDETMKDTLIDLANYTVMTMMWLGDNE